MRLQYKILLIILPLVLLPFITNSIFSYLNKKKVSHQLEITQLKNFELEVSQNINQFLASHNTAIKYFINTPSFHSAITKLKFEELQLISQQFTQSYSSIKFLSLSNSELDNKHPLFSSSSTVRLFIDPSVEDYEEKELSFALNQPKEWKLSRFAKLNEPVFIISLPIYVESDDNKHNSMFVNAVISPDWQQLTKSKHQLNQFVLITSRQGEVRLTSPFNLLSGQIPRYLFEQLSEQANSISLPFVHAQLGNEHYRLRGLSLTNDSFLFVAQSELQTVNEAITINRWFELILLLSVILFSIAVIYFSITKLVIEPISRLAKAKQQVAQGHLNVKLKASSHGDEINELVAAFNIMVRQLIVYREKENDSRLKLEYKVVERTAELEHANTSLENSNTELKKAQVLSEQANQLKSSFVANISHEIRTPLTAILGFTEQVLADQPRTKHQESLLLKVQNSGKHLLSLINDILDLSKIEADRLELQYSDVEIFSLFNDIESIISNQVVNTNLTLEFEYNYPLPRVIESDETRLKQVLLNLISNAVKFTERGKVKVSVDYDSALELINVSVLDSGIGMDQEALSYIFEPFTQADLSISRRFGGTGLGLVISKSLAKLLGGDITVTSELGVGSEFVFTFSSDLHHTGKLLSLVQSAKDIGNVKHSEHAPLSFSEDTNTTQKVADFNKAKESGQVTGKILLAEDVADNQYLFEMILTSLGARTTIAGNGEEAVEKAMVEDFDLILMDMQMPIMGGLEATEILRMAGIDTPIYALTANVMKEDMELHKKAGCTGTIAKPIDRAKFNEVVISNLKNKKVVQGFSNDKLEELKQNYVAGLPEQLNLMQQMFNDKDRQGLTKESHKIKGSAGNYGLGEVSKQAAVLEQLCQKSNNDWKDITLAYTELSNSITNLLDK